MRIRNPPILALGLMCLLVSVAAGAILVHDGEVGTDEAVLNRVAEGDALRLKGEWSPCCEGLRDMGVPLQEHSVLLESKGLQARVLATSDEPLGSDGALVVSGEVLYAGPDPERPGERLVVLQAQAVTVPILFG